jgi:hypothetical protein
VAVRTWAYANAAVGAGWQSYGHCYAAVSPPPRAGLSLRSPIVATERAREHGAGTCGGALGVALGVCVGTSRVSWTRSAEVRTSVDASTQAFVRSRVRFAAYNGT